MVRLNVRFPLIPVASFLASLGIAGAVVMAHASPESQEVFVRQWGLWAIVASSVCFVVVLFAGRQEMWRALGAMKRVDWLLVLSTYVFITASSPWEFKTLMDEGVILGISKQMIATGEASVPTLAITTPEGARNFDGYIDKRPLLQPALVAALHRLTGYRPVNAILVNVFAGLLFLLLAWHIGFRISGASGARLSVLLWASVPLLSITATAAGLELVNLTLIAGVALLAIAFWKLPSPRRLAALVWAGALLAQTRYESALFLAAVVVAVVATWIRQRTVVFSWWVTPLPILATPVIFIRTLATGPAWAWEVAERTAGTHYFSLANMPQNLRMAGEFFLDSSLRHATSLLVVVLGLGLAPLAFRQFRAMLRRGSDSQATAIGVMLVSGAASLLFPVLMCYYWADFRDPAAARLALVLFFPLIVSAILGVAWLSERMAVWSAVAAFCAVFTLVWTSAILAQKRHDDLARDTNQWNWLAGRISASSPDVLWVLPASLWPIVHGRDAMPLDSANAAPQRLQQLLRDGRYQSVNFVEVFRVLMPEAELIQSDRSRTSSRFVLESVAEFSGQPFWVQRVSRLKEVRP